MPPMIEHYLDSVSRLPGCERRAYHKNLHSTEWVKDVGSVDMNIMKVSDLFL